MSHNDVFNPATRRRQMFKELLALGIGSGTIYRVGLTEGRVDAVYDKAGPFPDGVVVEGGTVFWTTMGVPARDPAAKGEDSRYHGLDYSQRNGGLHAVGLDGSDARDVIAAGAITTGKQLVSDGAGTLYWGDREGCRVSRVRVDGSGLTDLVVNTGDGSLLQECVGVAVDPVRGHLYWTQKGPAKGGQGRIFRAGLEIPSGETASDRTDIEVLWEHLPEPIDLEICGDWLYWTDRGAPPKGNTLNCAPVPASGEKGTDPRFSPMGSARPSASPWTAGPGSCMSRTWAGRFGPCRSREVRCLALVWSPNCTNPSPGSSESAPTRNEMN